MTSLLTLRPANTAIMRKRIWFLVAGLVGMALGGDVLRGASPGAELPAKLATQSNSLAEVIVRSTLALTNGQSPPPTNGSAYSAFSSPMQYSFGVPPPDPSWTNWVYTRNTNFWLNGVQGLDALNVFPYQMQLTLVTPRHCLTIAHMQGCGSNVMVCFVGTNNTICWRRSLGTVAIGHQLRACILDSPVPIAPMPVISGPDLAKKLVTLNRTDLAGRRFKSVPLILFNQRWQAWVGDLMSVSQEVLFHQDRSVWLDGWSSAVSGPAVVAGDSGSARCVVIDHQLCLVGITAFTTAEAGIYDIGAINASLDQLSAQTKQPTNHVNVLDVSAYPAY